MHKVIPITCQEEAVYHGRKSGWCTRHADSAHWKHYTPDKGELFVICKPGRDIPSWQIFLSKRGSVELRDKQNKHVHIDTFFNEVVPELREWFESNKYEESAAELLAREQARNTVDIRRLIGGRALRGLDVSVNHNPVFRFEIEGFINAAIAPSNEEILNFASIEELQQNIESIGPATVVHVADIGANAFVVSIENEITGQGEFKRRIVFRTY